MPKLIRLTAMPQPQLLQDQFRLVSMVDTSQVHNMVEDLTMFFLAFEFIKPISVVHAFSLQ